MNDQVEGKVVIDIGRQYVWVYLCDGRGRILDQESFKYPVRIAREDALSETKAAFDTVYDYCNEIINDSTDSASGGEPPAKSG